MGFRWRLGVEFATISGTKKKALGIFETMSEAERSVSSSVYSCPSKIVGHIQNLGHRICFQYGVCSNV